MNLVINRPVLLLLVSSALMWIAGWLGIVVLRRSRKLDQDVRADFGVILTATLTLLGLIIGFSFSMATTRYDLRKNYEEAEANAIGTEWLRAELLPAPATAQVRALLKEYTDLRIRFYAERDPALLDEINSRTAALQARLWAAVRGPAAEQQNPVIALTVAGMNDVLNSQGYTQAAFWNRIPGGAWLLMFFIALVANAMVGYGAQEQRVPPMLLLLLPVLLSVSFYLVADIDSPRSGIIHVIPQNLISLAASLR